MTTTAMLQKEIATLRRRVAELENQLIRPEQMVLALPEKGGSRDITERKQAEELLRQSEQKYRQLFSEMSNGCALHEIICNDDGSPVDYITLEINHAYEAFLGITSKDVIGKKASEMLPPAELEKWLEIFGPVALTEKSTHYEMYSPLNQKYFEGSVYCPEIGKFAVTFTDITERKQAEAALNESETKYRLLVETANEGIWAMDKEHRTTYINQAMAEMLGYTPVEMLGKKVEEFFFAEDMAFHSERMRQRHTGQDEVYERRFKRWDGSALWTLVSARVIKDSQGEFNGSFAMFTDITERKQAEAALRKSEALLAEAQRIGHIGHWEWTAPGREIICSDELRRILELPQGCPILHETIKARVSPAEQARLFQLDQKAFANRDNLDYEFCISRADGQVDWLHQQVSVTYAEDGQPVRMIGVIQDITERKQAEVELQVSTEKFNALFINAPLEAVIYRLIRDPQGQIVDWEISDINPLGAASLSQSADALIGQRISDLLGQEVFDPYLELSRQVILTGQPRLFETHFETNGRDYLSSVFMVGADHYANISVDITERKQAEAALGESEERFRLFMDNSPTIAWIQDDQSRYVYLNQTYEKRFGVQLEAWRGKTTFEVWPHEEAQRLWQNDQKVLAANHTLEFTEEIPNPDGSLSTWWSFKFPFQGVSGQRYAAGVALDITERKAAEEALRISEARYRLIADHLNDIIWQLDQELRFVYTSPAVEHILGYSIEETNQFSITDLLDAEGLALMRQVISRKLDHPEEKMDTITEYKMRHKAGHMIEVEVVSAPIFDENGQCTGFTGVTRDIRERKHTEAARIKLEEQLRQAQKMESIGRLAGGVAHDFNNLLTVIIGYTDLMQTGLAAHDPMLEKLEQVIHASEQAEGLTRQLLAFSRKQILAPVVLDLNELVTNLHKMLGRLIGEDITLATALQPGLWSIKADPGQIEQVLLNLAVNARDAMPQGGRLTIQTVNVELEGVNVPGVLLAVADTGHGMDETILAHIFEPFFTTKEQGKGTGLGLATVYGIVKQSGGEIIVESQPGEGTIFKIYLPADQAAVARSTSLRPQQAARAGYETILLVEDNPMVRNLVRVALRNYGYTLLEAEQGQQALALAEQHQGAIELLLTDVIMPEMSGREVAERLQALYPHIKVLFMSGYTDDEVIQHGLLTDEVEFISKPFSPNFLAAKVREILDE